MRIEINQIVSEGENSFEILKNKNLLYRADLPFIQINDGFNLEKIRKIKVLDINNNIIYTSDYNYIENYVEEFIPLKYLVTGSQKFNQLVFKSINKEFKVYYESNEVLKGSYIIEYNGKKYNVYSVEDGYIRHFPIFINDIQIGEVLKSNVVYNAKDSYCCFLKDEYEELADGIIMLFLFLDRFEYNSSYYMVESTNITKKYSYNKNNKYYDPNWVKNNFDCSDFFLKVDNDVLAVKEVFTNKIKHPIKSMSKNEKQLLLVILIFIGGLFLFFIVMFSVLFFLVN